MSAQSFNSRLYRLCALAWAQRAARILLRAGWLGGGLFLLYWHAAGALNQPVKPWVLWAGGSLIAAWAIVCLIFPLPVRHAIAWRLDRRLGLRETVTTAWQVADRGDNTPLARLLLDDANRVLEPALRRVALRGWYLSRDLVSAAIIAVLFFLTVQAQNAAPMPAIPPQTQSLLPALGQDAGAADVFPSGIPGLENQAKQGQNQSGYTPDQLDQASQSLSKMGEKLSQSAATYDLGQSLQQSDLNNASKSLEQLSGQLESLSQGTQQNLAETMQESAEDLKGTAVQPLAEHLQEAADNLRQGKTEGATQAFDQLSLDMKELSEGLSRQNVTETSGGQANQGGGGATIGGPGTQTSDSQPFTRLEGGEGQSIELPPGAAGTSLVQSPPGGPGGGALVTAPSNAPQSQQIDFYDIFLTPYHYPWNWRDVVSKYFSR